MKMFAKKYTQIKDFPLTLELDVDVIYHGLKKTYYFKYATYIKNKKEVIKALNSYKCVDKYFDKGIDYVNYYILKEFGLYAMLVYAIDHRTSYYEIVTIEQYKKKSAVIKYDVKDIKEETIGVSNDSEALTISLYNNENKESEE